MVLIVILKPCLLLTLSAPENTMDWLDLPMEVRLQVYKLAVWLHKQTILHNMLLRRAQPQTISASSPTVVLNLFLSPFNFHRVSHILHIPGRRITKTSQSCGDIGVSLDLLGWHDNIQMHLGTTHLTDCESGQVFWGVWPEDTKQA